MITQNQLYSAGIDIGSTTAKIAILDSNDHVVFTSYERHNTKIIETLLDILKSVHTKFGNIELKTTITGSAGMGICEKKGIPFVQEVVAATEVIKKKYSQVQTLIDLGGEDSKMIFLHAGKAPDIRMNGSCAGGTGAFIDQMASLLGVTLAEFDQLAANHSNKYPIASRCGVFAKTDVQNLVSRKISKEDIAASVFHAVSVQTINALARGADIVPKIMFTGGPFTFLPQLGKAFENLLNLSDVEIITPEHQELMPAIGAALLGKT